MRLAKKTELIAITEGKRTGIYASEAVLFK